MAGTIDDKYVTVETLRRLLDGLPPQTKVSTRTLANTGNITLRDEDFVHLGYIDLLHEEVELV
jgi:hypothetical protein